jgi:hypothetical protein
MKDFIEITQSGKPHKLINVHQISDVTVTSNYLRLRMSSGETISLVMSYEEFCKLIKKVTTVEEKRSKSDVRVLTVFP